MNTATAPKTKQPRWADESLYAMGQEIQGEFKKYETRTGEVLGEYMARPNQHWAFGNLDLCELLAAPFPERDCFPSLPQEIEALTVAEGMALLRMARGVQWLDLGEAPIEGHYRLRIGDLVRKLFVGESTLRCDVLNMRLERVRGDDKGVVRIASSLAHSRNFIELPRSKGYGVMWPILAKFRSHPAIAEVLNP